MKRTLASLLSLMALTGITMLSSCSKEDVGDGTQFRATMEGCAARDGKTTLSGMSLNWVSGDQVAIYGTAGCGLYSATPQTPATTAVFNNVSGTTGDGPFRAFYPSTLTDDGVNITLPAAQTYVENSLNEFPMYAESATNQLAFKNLCGVLKLHLTKANTNITTISVTANAEICGDFTVSYVNGVPYLSYTGNGSKTVTMACAPAQAIDNGRDFYIALPAFDSLKSITLTTDDGRVCTKTVKSNVCIGVQRSTVTEITFGENDLNFILPEGAVPGLFTINANGDQVWFSQGNLQYQASTDTWRFAENQWDFVGIGTRGNVYENGVKCDNALISATYSGWIDLFGWGTGYNPTLVSTNNSDYSTFVDWGVNEISNGGNETGLWRTLTQSEWYYILSVRNNYREKLGMGEIDGVGGVIILPDVWIQPVGVPFTPGLSSSMFSWGPNHYTAEQWEVMQANGAIFLQAAGDRNGGGNDVGNYWSSTRNSYATAICLYYHPRHYPNVEFYYSEYCQHGHSVRLVQNVQ